MYLSHSNDKKSLQASPSPFQFSFQKQNSNFKQFAFIPPSYNFPSFPLSPLKFISKSTLPFDQNDFNSLSFKHYDSGKSPPLPNTKYSSLEDCSNSNNSHIIYSFCDYFNTNNSYSMKYSLYRNDKTHSKRSCDVFQNLRKQKQSDKDVMNKFNGEDEVCKCKKTLNIKRKRNNNKIIKSSLIDEDGVDGSSNEEVFVDLESKNIEMLLSRMTRHSKDIFYIDKVINKEEYDMMHPNNNNCNKVNNNEYHITLMKIEKIFTKNCVLLYQQYITNNNNNKSECSDIQQQLHQTHQQQVVDVKLIIKTIIRLIRTKKIKKYIPPPSHTTTTSHSKLQAKRNHYFMFYPDAKQFCVELHTKYKLPLDFIEKLCEVPRKSLRRWTIVGYCRKKGGGRKIKEPDLEPKLLSWINTYIQANNTVPSNLSIRNKALQLSQRKDFIASKGWLDKFKTKHKLKGII